LEGSAGSADPQAALGAAQRAKFLAELNLAKAKLMGETASFSSYIASAKAWDDALLSELTSFREKAEELLENAVCLHTDVFFPIECLDDRSRFFNFAESSLSRLAENSQCRSASDVLRFSIYNLSVRPLVFGCCGVS
jgi:hypothetical protein